MPLELSLLDHPALLNIFWEYPYIDVFAAYILIHYKAVFCFFYFASPESKLHNKYASRPAGAKTYDKAHETSFKGGS
jgi:hypothetical protein